MLNILILSQNRYYVKDKFAILSIPKSGTHYMFEIFKLLGIPPAKSTIIDKRLPIVLPHFRNPKINLNQYDLQKVTLEAIEMVNTGEVTCGHLPHTEIYLNVLKEFKIIFLKRNLRSAFVSLARALDNFKKIKTLDEKKIFINFIKGCKPYSLDLHKSLLPWNNQVYTMRYEDITSMLTGPKALQGMCNHLGLSCKNPHKIIETALNTNTRTRNKIKTQREFYWNAEVEKWYVENGWPELNRSLGYED